MQHDSFSFPSVSFFTGSQDHLLLLLLSHLLFLTLAQPSLSLEVHSDLRPSTHLPLLITADITCMEQIISWGTTIAPSSSGWRCRSSAIRVAAAYFPQCLSASPLTKGSVRQRSKKRKRLDTYKYTLRCLCCEGCPGYFCFTSLPIFTLKPHKPPQFLSWARSHDPEHREQFCSMFSYDEVQPWPHPLD